MLVIMAGLPGTGKSTVARALAERTGAFVLDKDSLRAALFPAPLIEHSREQDDFVVRVMLKVAGWILRRDTAAVVILDGRPFARKYQLDQVVNFARWIQTSWRILECTCSEPAARARLQQSTHIAGDRDFDLYRRLQSEWEEIARPKLVLDTDSALDGLVDRAVSYVRDDGENIAARPEL